MTSKIIDPKDLIDMRSRIRMESKTLATLNGSFDLLHAGHLYILSEAARQADFLLVALNSDVSIQTYKSKERPIIPLSHRMEMLAALEVVDFVTWFDETDPRALLAQLEPDVHVNGAEYGPKCIESEVIEAFGGRLHLVPRIDGLATSEIIAKIRSLCD